MKNMKAPNKPNDKGKCLYIEFVLCFFLTIYCDFFFYVKYKHPTYIRVYIYIIRTSLETVHIELNPKNNICGYIIKYMLKIEYKREYHLYFFYHFYALYYCAIKNPPFLLLYMTNMIFLRVI